jgi:predicted DNA-binding protein
MQSARRRNFHLPLEQETYARLVREAERVGRPATQVAREAIEIGLDERHRRIVAESISAYATAVAGSRDDLDEDLERAATEHLAKRRGRKP